MERDVEQTMNNRFSPYDRDRDFRRIVFSFEKNTRIFGHFEAVSHDEFCETVCQKDAKFVKFLVLLGRMKTV